MNHIFLDFSLNTQSFSKMADVKLDRNLCSSRILTLPKDQELSLQIAACQGSGQASLWSLAQSPGLVKYALYYWLYFKGKKVKVIVAFYGRKKWESESVFYKKAFASLVKDCHSDLRPGKIRREKNWSKLFKILSTPRVANCHFLHCRWNLSLACVHCKKILCMIIEKIFNTTTQTQNGTTYIK